MPGPGVDGKGGVCVSVGNKRRSDPHDADARITGWEAEEDDFVFWNEWQVSSPFSLLTPYIEGYFLASEGDC